MDVITASNQPKRTRTNLVWPTAYADASLCPDDGFRMRRIENEHPVRDELPLWPTRASDPGATKSIRCAAPPIPVAQPAVGSVTAYTPVNPGGILPASRSTTERRLPRSPARDAPQLAHAQKKAVALLPPPKHQSSASRPRHFLLPRCLKMSICALSEINCSMSLRTTKLTGKPCCFDTSAKTRFKSGEMRMLRLTSCINTSLRQCAHIVTHNAASRQYICGTK
nr:MAG TPA: hypothetical protein [Inoviridae sp.]